MSRLIFHNESSVSVIAVTWDQKTWQAVLGWPLSFFEPQDVTLENKAGTYGNYIKK